MTKIYQVIVNNKVVKEYPTKFQAETYCLMKGYVYRGYDEWNSFNEVVVLDDKVKVVEKDVEVDSKSNV